MNNTNTPITLVLFNGFECIEMDLGDSCTAHATPYADANIDFTSNPTDESIHNACKNANGGVDNCEVRVCTVEVAFLRDWWGIQTQVFAQTFDNELSTYQHSADADAFPNRSGDCYRIKKQ